MKIIYIDFLNNILSYITSFYFSFLKWWKMNPAYISISSVELWTPIFLTVFITRFFSMMYELFSDFFNRHSKLVVLIKVWLRYWFSKRSVIIMIPVQNKMHRLSTVPCFGQYTHLCCCFFSEERQKLLNDGFWLLPFFFFFSVQAMSFHVLWPFWGITMKMVKEKLSCFIGFHDRG